MRKNILNILFYMFVLAVCLSFSLFFCRILFAYTVPIQDASYDLSLSWEGEAMPDDWQYDQKGWTVFLQDETQATLLTANEFGGFNGIPESEQTFYFSRTLTEMLENPTLRLEPADHSIAIFLDDELLYTDDPKQDNRIGYLALTMLDWNRIEPVEVSIPPDYYGKTLTIAQSVGMERQQDTDSFFTVYPCSVSLFSNYSYESGLIAKSFRIAIPASLYFGAGVLLLAVFLWQLFSQKTDWSLLFLALTSFLWSAQCIATDTLPYYLSYFSRLPVDVAGTAHDLSTTVLLLFLANRLTGKPRSFFAIAATLHGICVLLYAIPDIPAAYIFLLLSISEKIGLYGMLGILICMIREWKQKNSFYRFFCPLITAESIVFMIWILVVPALRQEIVQQFSLSATSYFLWKLMLLMIPAAILAALIEWIAKEISRRTEAKLLTQQYGLAQASLENLRRHQEEVMMLHHDMKKHLTFLRQKTSDKATADYLDELIGQQQEFSPVVQSRNQTLDIILNAKLGEAADKGIAVEIVQINAPESLPLTDAELCALMINLLDNAIFAASKTETPFLRLDMHQKDGFFVFICENSASSDPPEKSVKKETVPQHGLGLKIIEQIINQHGNLMEMTRLFDTYRVTIALPLCHSRK